MSKKLLLFLFIILVHASVAVFAEAQIKASLMLDSSNPSGTCTSEVVFKGTVTSEKPGKIQYKFIRSDGAILPVETLDFNAPGTKEIISRWNLNGQFQPEYKGWQAVRTVYPYETESDRADFSFTCDPSKPDLALKIKGCPSVAKPGSDIKSSMKLRAFNYGGIDVKDATVDITLRKDSACQLPLKHAEYSPDYSNGVLLLGGREKVSIKAGQKADLKLKGSNTIPHDTPEGDYFLCAVIDAGDTIKESNEANNCACCPVKIAHIVAKPDLIVERFSFKGWGKCEPRSPLMMFEVTIRNAGNAASPAMPDRTMVQVGDLDEKGWHNSVGLGSIPPGGRQTVIIPVFYYERNPDHMLRVVPHPFRAVIDPNNLIEESSRKNNRSDVIYLDPGSVCVKESSQ
jgi:hypothetical protein